jgi:hypothetical protein
VSRKRVSTFIVTAHRLDTAYGPVRVPEDQMAGLVARLREGNVITQAQHDARLPMTLELVSAEVRPTDDGTLGVWVEVEVDEDEWERGGGDLLEGWSVTLAQPFLREEAEGAPHLELNADAAHFADEDIEAAARELKQHFSVAAGRIYQFSVVPPPNVYLSASLDVLRDLVIGVAAAALYGGLRHLLRPRHAERSIFTFKFRDGDKEVSARIETNSEEALRQAIDKMPELADSPEHYHSYDEDQGEWHGYL